ncbi:hypothetical protein D3C80_1887110 [compost metagenome]
MLSQAMGQRTIEQKTVAQALAFGRLNLGSVLQQPLIRVEQQQVEARERRFLRRIDRDVGWQAPPAFAQWQWRRCLGLAKRAGGMQKLLKNMHLRLLRNGFDHLPERVAFLLWWR